MLTMAQGLTSEVNKVCPHRLRNTSISEIMSAKEKVSPGQGSALRTLVGKGFIKVPNMWRMHSREGTS